MRTQAPVKSATAFRTISEVSADLDVPQHVLRFWETKFPQIRPLKRGGGRRYYRPEDVDLLRRIRALLYEDKYTIKGVQRLLKEGRVSDPSPPLPEDAEEEDTPQLPLEPSEPSEPSDADLAALDEAGGLSEGVRQQIELVVDELRSLRALLDKAGGKKAGMER